MSTTALIIYTLLLTVLATRSQAAPGSWRLLQKSVGISAMHMQYLNNDRVILLDRTNIGASKINLPNGKCRNNPRDLFLKKDCTAHSVEYIPKTNTYRPLTIFTDTWCSSGAVTPDGRLVQTGGWFDGEKGVRLFQPCATCDWKELGDKLLRPRWYATNHILPDGQIIIVGGRAEPNYEFYPKQSLHDLPFLKQTANPENNLYPFVFLNVDGNLFIFSNNRAILLNYKTNKVVRTYATVPGGDPRCYPSTGSAVLLPLKNIDNKAVEAEVLVCGGAPKKSLDQARKGNFIPALKTCARLKITDTNPKWVMETMPTPRVMGDMILLPDGRVLLINGAQLGAAGFGVARNPVLNPVIYNPDGKLGARFEVQTATKTPRMYHSTAILLRDGRVLVGGSNTHARYTFTGQFPTDLSLEAFSPWYLGTGAAIKQVKPTILSSMTTVKYKQLVPVKFAVAGAVDANKVKVVMIMPPFNTHSFSQGQRALVLTRVGGIAKQTTVLYRMVVRMPSSGNLAPSGYYLVFVVHQGVPSEGKWVKIG